MVFNVVHRDKTSHNQNNKLNITSALFKHVFMVLHGSTIIVYSLFLRVETILIEWGLTNTMKNKQALVFNGKKYVLLFQKMYLASDLTRFKFYRLVQISVFRFSMC